MEQAQTDFPFQPKVKKKKNLAFSLDTVRERLRGIGYDLFQITLDKATQDITVTREFLSDQYGGNPQAIFPTISEENFRRHGLDDFMFPSFSVSFSNLLIVLPVSVDIRVPKYHPHCPEVPGAPGLYFETTLKLVKVWPKEQRIITRLDSGVWQYQGQYKLARAASLTKEEWNAQKPQV